MQCQHSQQQQQRESRAKFAKPAPSADAGEGAANGFILPADDGRGSTFYQAVKKLLQQTIETSGGGERCKGQTCNFLARSSFCCAAPSDTDAGPRPKEELKLEAVTHNAHNEVHFSYSRKN